MVRSGAPPSGAPAPRSKAKGSPAPAPGPAARKAAATAAAAAAGEEEQLQELIDIIKATSGEAGVAAAGGASASGSASSAGSNGQSTPAAPSTPTVLSRKGVSTTAHASMPPSSSIAASASDPALLHPASTTGVHGSAPVAAPAAAAPVAAPSSRSGKRPKNAEESRLDAFLLRHSKSYRFPGPQYAALLAHLLQSRMLSETWVRAASREHRLRVLRAVRVLSRDPTLQEAFLAYRPLPALASSLRSYASEYFVSEPAYCAESIVEVCSILKRVASEDAQDKRIFELSFMASLVQLLAARDAQVLQAVLVTLVNLSGSPLFVERVVELPILEPLLAILSDAASQSISAGAAAAAAAHASSQVAAVPATPAFSQSQPLSGSARSAAASASTAAADASAAAPSTSSSSSSSVSVSAASALPTYHFLAAELLDLLSEYHECRLELQLLSGNSVFLRVLHRARDSEQLCLPLLRCIANQALEADSSREIRFLGGIQQMLAIIAPDLPSARTASHSQLPPPSSSTTPAPPPPSEAMLIGATICLTQLALDDENAFQIRKAQGVYALGRLFLRGSAAASITHPASSTGGAFAASLPTPLPSTATTAASSLSRDVQCHACRALRFLYSVERNRALFKRFFVAPDLFATFIDVGHYVHAITPYERVVDALEEAGTHVQAAMWEALEEMRAAGNIVLASAAATAGANGASNAPGPHGSNSSTSNSSSSSSHPGSSTPCIRGYVVQEVLGKGAFGTVYQVQKENGDKLYAMKELSLKELQKASGPAAGGGRDGGSHTAATTEQARAAASELTKEVDILSQLDHPNIVRYYSSFMEGGCVYIVMELVSGSSLLDHINGWVEKGGGVAMREESIWPLFIQLCLALCYMHMEKRVVHRDLTPNNVMINDRKQVKIADFGLARQTHNGTLLQSAVGTISFACPEIVMHETYTDKADIWSLGCILYQMATGKPAFAGSNPLTVAQKIVAGSYDPIPSSYSPLFHEMVRRLLTVDPNQRPDILAVSSLISPLLMAELDRVNIGAERMAQQMAHEAEARRRDRDEWNRERQTYRRWMAKAQGQSRGGHSQAAAGLPSPSTTSPLTSSRDAAATPVAGQHASDDPPSSSSSSSSTSGGPGSGRGVDGGAPGPDDAPASSPLFRVSSHAVRPRSHDPLTLMLSQLHKLIYVSQLPPKSSRDLKRTLIGRYKHALFARGGAGGHAAALLKQEMQQLISGSRSLIHSSFELPHLDANLALLTSPAQGSGSAGAAHMHPHAQSGGAGAHALTHEEMQLMLEQVLEEAGYYAPVPEQNIGPEAHTERMNGREDL